MNQKKNGGDPVKRSDLYEYDWVRTYTCSVCGETKEEAVKYVSTVKNLISYASCCLDPLQAQDDTVSGTQ